MTEHKHKWYFHDKRMMLIRCDCGAEKKAPQLVEMSIIANSFGWPSRKVRRILIAAGLATKIGGYWYSSMRLVKNRWRELFQDY